MNERIQKFIEQSKGKFGPYFLEIMIAVSATYLVVYFISV